MIRRRRVRATSALVLVPFLALCIGPAPGWAQEPPQGDSKAPAAPGSRPLVPPPGSSAPSPSQREPGASSEEEQLSVALGEVHELLKELVPAAAMPEAARVRARVQRAREAKGGERSPAGARFGRPPNQVVPAAKLAALRAKLREIERRQDSDELIFVDAERSLRKLRLPPEVLARHRAAVAEYRARRAEFDRLARNAQSAPDAGEELGKALSSLGAFMSENPSTRAHTPSDPDQLPWRGVRPAARKPYVSLSAFDRSGLFGDAVRLAQAGSISGIALPSTMPPPLPTPEDLGETDEVRLTQSIRDSAAALGNNPVQIYAWVRNNIEFVPSFGSIQPAELTLLTRRGNSFDTASLLIALLRASGIPARYAYGTIEVAADQAMNWVGGVGTPEAALDLLGQGGIPNVGVISGGRINRIRLEHVWVEGWIDFVPSRGAVQRSGDTWIPLDASFKQYDYSRGLDLPTNQPFDAAAFNDRIKQAAEINESEGWVRNIDKAVVAEQLAGYRDQVAAYIKAQKPDALLKDVSGGRAIIEENASLLRGTLPNRTLVVASRFSDMPESLRHQLTLALYASEADYGSRNASLTFTSSLPRVLAKRLGVSYTPSTAQDRAVIDAQIASNAASLPAYLIRVTPQLRLEGETLAEGPSIGMGTPNVWEATLRDPLELQTSPVVFRATAGDELVFALNGSGLTPDTVAARFARVDSSTAAEGLHEVGLHYWLEHDLFDASAAQSNRVVQYRLPSIALVSYALGVRTFFGISRAASYRGRQIDAKRVLASVVGPERRAETAFRLQAGAQGSYFEGSVLDQLFARPDGKAVSAMQAIATAVEQGVRLYTVTDANVGTALPALAVSGDVKADIETAVAAGKVVSVPAAEVSFGSWRGTGYVIVDPDTGAGAYLIEGGFNGAKLPECQAQLSPKGKEIVAAALLALLLLAAASNIPPAAAVVAFSGGAAVAGGLALTTVAVAFAGAIVVSFALIAVFYLMASIIRTELAEAEMVAASSATDCECAPDPKPPECRCQEEQSDAKRNDRFHDECADRTGPNLHPGFDTCVTPSPSQTALCYDSKSSSTTVWEVKTDRFDTYKPFIQAVEVGKNFLQARAQKQIADKCGLTLRWLVGTPEHALALLADPGFAALGIPVEVDPTCRRPDP